MTLRWALVIAIFASVACSRRGGDVSRLAPNGVPLAPNVTCAAADCRAYDVVPYVRDRSQYGIGCLGNVPPGTVPNSTAPPESYRLDDAERPGVPKMTDDERALVRRVRRDVRVATLRFAWVVYATTPGRFIIFDALDGPCGTGRPSVVLNGTCNEAYEPGENPYQTIAVPGCYRETPRPWLSTKRANASI